MPAVAEDRPPSTKWVPTKAEQEDLAAIDAVLTRMKKVTAPDPYVLTIPQEVEPRYHHTHQQQAYAWLSNTPFTRGEHESLQYQTFVFHEHGKDMYVLQSSRPEELLVPGRARSGTGASTPSIGPKKKITLDAYKKGKATKMATPEREPVKAANKDTATRQGAVKGPVERVKAETEEMLAAVAEAEEPLPPVKNNSELPREAKELKRKRSEHEPESTANSSKDMHPRGTVVNGNGTETSNKKQKTMERTSLKDIATAKLPKRAEQTSRPGDRTGSKDLTEEKAMPPRLSPGMPPRLSPGMPARLSPLQQEKASHATEPSDPPDFQALPRRLSPTIPDNIARTLETREQHNVDSRGSNLSAPSSASKTRDGKLTPSKRYDGNVKHKSPLPRNAFRASSSSPAVHTDAEDKGRRAAAIVPRPRSPERSRKEDGADGKDSSVSTKAQPGRLALLVKIKVKKGRREALQRILKMRPSPGQPTSEAEKAAPSNLVEQRNGERNDLGPQKGVAHKIGPIKKEKGAAQKVEAKPHIAEKRPPPVDELASPPAKRKRAEVPELTKEPSTPAQQDLDSPQALRSGLQATPGTRKDLLSGATKVEQSQDSPLTQNTPSALPSTPSVTSQSSQLNGSAKIPSSQPGTKTARQQAWETEQKRLETLGRELKHAASAHLTASQSTSSSSSSGSSSPELKLAASKSVESLLCYFLAFTCADEAALAAEPKQAPANKTWRSLHGFYAFVKRHTEIFPALCGLVCSLGVAFSAHVLQLATQFPADGPSRESLIDMQALLLKAAGDAEARLDLEALQAAFPKAWSQRTTTTTTTTGKASSAPQQADQQQQLEPHRLGGQYRLPMGLTTSPVKAVRAAHVMLKEWIEREGLNYNLKLRL